MIAFFFASSSCFKYSASSSFVSKQFRKFSEAFYFFASAPICARNAQKFKNSYFAGAFRVISLRINPQIVPFLPDFFIYIFIKTSSIFSFFSQVLNQFNLVRLTGFLQKFYRFLAGSSRRRKVCFSFEIARIFSSKSRKSSGISVLGKSKS